MKFEMADSWETEVCYFFLAQINGGCINHFIPALVSIFKTCPKYVWIKHTKLKLNTWASGIDWYAWNKEPLLKLCNINS